MSEQATIVLAVIGGVCAGYVLGLTRPLRALEAWNWRRCVDWIDLDLSKSRMAFDIALFACFHPGKFWHIVRLRGEQ